MSTHRSISPWAQRYRDWKQLWNENRLLFVMGMAVVASALVAVTAVMLSAQGLHLTAILVILFGLAAVWITSAWAVLYTPIGAEPA